MAWLGAALQMEWYDAKSMGEHTRRTLCMKLNVAATTVAPCKPDVFDGHFRLLFLECTMRLAGLHCELFGNVGER